MKSWHEYLDDDYKASAKSVTIARLAAEFDVCEQTVRNWKTGEQNFILANAEKWRKLTQGNGLAHWACDLCDHIAVPKPDPDKDAVASVPALLREFADLIDSINAAVADNDVTTTEATNVRVEGEELVRAVYGAIFAVEKLAKISKMPKRAKTMKDAS